MPADRSSAFDAPQPQPAREQESGLAKLTRAEARALERSAPLRPEQFKELRRLAEQGVNPLRRL